MITYTMKEIGDNLLGLRTQAGLSRAKVAKEIKVTELSIINWEKGRKQPHILTLANLLDLYSERLGRNITVDEVLNRETEAITFFPRELGRYSRCDNHNGAERDIENK